MKELVKRTLAGFVFVLAVISSIYFSQIGFYVLFSFITVLASLEYSKLAKLNSKVYSYFYAFLSFLIFSIVFLVTYGLAEGKIAALIIPILFVPAIIELFKKDSNTNSIAKAVFGLIYTSTAFALMNLYFANETYKMLLLSIFVLIWTFDSFAYLAGVSMGKRKLFPSISPKKSWEGFIGGIVLTSIASYFISLYFENINALIFISIAVIISLISTLGDLIESKLKRSADVKDSGKILPGHGGLLDRFDAVLLVIPIISVFLLFVL